MKWAKRVLIAIPILAIVLPVGTCLLVLPPFWDMRYVSRSPDGRSEIRVDELALGSDSTLLVRVRTRKGWIDLTQKSDCWFSFAHAAWRGTVVAIYVDGRICGPLVASFDVAQSRPTDYEEVESWLGEDIVRSYQVSEQELRENDGDVFRWATDLGDGRVLRSRTEFRQRHR